MGGMNILVFEDRRVGQLYPVTTGRAAFAISCGSYALLDWLRLLSAESGAALRARVRHHLKNLLAQTLPELAQPLDPKRALTLVVNARCVPSVHAYKQWQSALSQGQERVWRDQHQLSAALVPTSALDCIDDPADEVEAYFKSQGSVASDDLKLFDYPHEIVDQNCKIIEANLAHRVHVGEYQQLADGVFVGRGATIDKTAIIRPGSLVVVDENATVGPFCLIQGPAYLGPRSRVIEHSAIKDEVSIGHTAKIGGEVEASVIESYTNKQHHGFLGHSYLGSWINLGAGTCNSDLKNTYGTVNMEYGNQKVNTEMQFVGCIMGDYAKTAINTGIFTGKLIGVCSMIYGFVTTNVPSFVNYARLFGQITELPPSVMAATQKRMFARRKVDQRPVDIQLLHDMYELTRSERQLAEEPLVL